MAVQIRLPGRITFAAGLELQNELVEAVTQDSKNETLILLEHEPVYTIGRTPDQSSLKDPGSLTHPLFQINRGGQATYHGPGQLVGYAILDLNGRGRDLHALLRSLEELILRICASFGVNGTRREGLTGVWVEDRKIASIGIGVRKWISMHGFALNVCGDLTPFQQIIPCGIQQVQMTSLTLESGRMIELDEVITRTGELFDTVVAPRTKTTDRGRDGVASAPPSEPDRPFSGIRLSG